jgi:hypothetical protein
MATVIDFLDRIKECGLINQGGYQKSCLDQWVNRLLFAIDSCQDKNNENPETVTKCLMESGRIQYILTTDEINLIKESLGKPGEVKSRLTSYYDRYLIDEFGKPRRNCYGQCLSDEFPEFDGSYYDQYSDNDFFESENCCDWQQDE